MAACLLPLLFINLRSTHDWGDDFAQYIHQAQNINAGLSQNNTGYVFNENCFTGPMAYPTGFPLLLAPVVSATGIDFIILNQYLSFFLLLAGISIFLISRFYVSFLPAALISIIFTYNPSLIHFKAQVLSDLPFTFFSALCILLVHLRQRYWLDVLFGMLMGFTIQIRSVGLILPLTYVIYELFIRHSIKDFSIRQHLHTFVVIASTLLSYFMINIAYPCNSNYPVFLGSEKFWQTLNDHFSYNLHHFSMIFRGYITPDYFFIGVLAASCMVAFILPGFLHFRRKFPKSFLLIYTPVFLLGVIFYRYSHAGIRLIIPVMAYFFLFASIGFKEVMLPFTRRMKLLAGIAGALVLFAYYDEIERIEKNKDSVQEGPQQPESKDIFNYINKHIPEKSVVAFDKPRALCLYTKIRCFNFYPAADAHQINSDISRLKAVYILTHLTETSDNIKNFVINDTARFRLIYSNGLFNLYQLNRRASGL